MTSSKIRNGRNGRKLTKSRMIEKILDWDKFLCYGCPEAQYRKEDLTEITMYELWMIYDMLRDDIRHGW